MANFNLDNYVPVNERIEKFYSDHPTGRIVTNILEHDHNSGFVLFQAMIFRDCECENPAATGHAYELAGQGHVNKTSHIENCETSAVGRALAMLGYEIQRGIASREEMQKVERQTAKTISKAADAIADLGTAVKGWNGKPSNGKPATGKATGEKDLATTAQITFINKLAVDHDIDADAFARKEFEGVAIGDLSKAAASYIIDQLQG